MNVDIGVVGVERGLAGRCWAIIGSACGVIVGLFETLTVLTLMSCCLIAVAPFLWN